MNSGLRLTPRASPAPRTPTTKSPIKTIREEPEYLSLHRVIGTTVSSTNAVSHVETLRMVAYTAGATVVVISLDQEHNVVQRTFRVSPSTSYISTSQAHLDSPITSALAQSQRSRASALPRELLSPLGALGPSVNDAVDSSNARLAGLRNKSKAATCVSLSQDGKWLAMGESGYKPRVHLFDLSKDYTSNHIPSSSLAEHAFGVKSLAFSPDSRYLASLGDVNDGFLFIWAIHQKTGTASLHASNKCTSNVKAMAWVGPNLVTVGTRHVKIWRVDRSPQASPSKRVDAAYTFASPSKALPGRNCVLGPLLDKTYSAVAAIDDRRAIICSEEGDVCLIEDTDSGPSIYKVASVEGSITSACVIASDKLLLCSEHGSFASLELRLLLDIDHTSDQPPSPEVKRIAVSSSIDIRALAPLGHFALFFGGRGSVEVSSVLARSLVDVSQAKLQQSFASHPAGIRGVKQASSAEFNGAAFVTFSEDGKIIVWDLNGHATSVINVSLQSGSPSPDQMSNTLKAVTPLRTGEVVYCGDGLGNLKAVDLGEGHELYETKAHAGEITSVDSHDGESCARVASASRDRTIQVYQATSSSFELMQTLDDHIGAVNCVRFTGDGSKLLSCAADRSILIRTEVAGQIDGSQRTAFVIQRTLNLKATPLCLELSLYSGAECFVVSAMDKSVGHYTIHDGSLSDSFRAGDYDDGDLVNLSCISSASVGRSKRVIAGIANADKSVRLYSTSGDLLGRDYGHTEALTGVAPIQKPGDHFASGLVSVATDGTICMWNLLHSQEPINGIIETPDVTQGTTKANAFFATQPPLRRVLSSSELLILQSSTDDDATPSATPRPRSRSPKRKSVRPVKSTIEDVRATPPPVSRRVKNASEPPEVQAGSRLRGAYSKPSTPPASPRRSQQSRVAPKEIRRRSSQPALSSLARQRNREEDTLGPSTATGGFGSHDLPNATQQVCRALQNYRRRLTTSCDPLPVEQVRELEKELAQTARALAEKAARSEAVLEKLLDRYGERLVEIMERRIDEKVGKLVEESTGLRKSGNDESTQSS